MPVPIPGPEVGSDSLKVEFLVIFGRPKIGFFGTFPGPRGTFPQFRLATNHAEDPSGLVGLGIQEYG